MSDYPNTYVKTAEELGWPVQLGHAVGLNFAIGDCLNDRLCPCEPDERVFRLVVDLHDGRHPQYSYVQFPVKK